MINFENIEALVSHMFDSVNTEDPVTVVADKDLAVDVLAELLTYNNIILEFVDIDSYEYDKEYYVTLSLDEDKINETDYWHVSIEKAYNNVQEAYFGTDGYVLFHEDINSKILVDIQNNENVTMSGHDWFIIGKDECFETDDEETGNNLTENDEDIHGFTVSKNDNNGYCSYSYYTSSILSRKEIEGMIKALEINSEF